jgi:hypothetical protein
MLVIVVLLAACSDRNGIEHRAPLSAMREAYLCLDESRPLDAVVLFERLRHAHPKDAELLYNLGVAYHRADQFGSARQCFEQAIRLRMDDPDFQVRCLYNRGVVLGRQARLYMGEDVARARDCIADAILCMNGVIAITPEHADALYNRDCLQQWFASLAEENHPDSEGSEGDGSGAQGQENPDQGDGGDEDGADGQDGGQNAVGPEQKSGPASERVQSGAASIGAMHDGSGEGMLLPEALLLLEGFENEERRLDLNQLLDHSEESLGEPQW